MTDEGIRRYFLKSQPMTPSITRAYPASPRHIPKKMKKNGARQGVGSVPP